MSSKKPRLGRGLDALLETTVKPLAGTEALRNIPIDLLQRGKYQPRTHMNKQALAELAESIRAQGVVQPIVVRELKSGNYEIVAGERRWRAAQLAALDSVPAVVRRIPDEAAIAISLIENIQREDLNPLEQAAALRRLIDEFGITHQQVAAKIGRSRAAVSNLLRLLSLNADVRALLQHNRLEMGHARALLALSGKAQSQLAQQVARQGLSVRATEALVRRRLERPAARKAPRRAAGADPDVRALQDDLSERLGTRVRISHQRSGKGKVTIEYGSVDELEGILDHIR
ncbi:MAG: ParB/RepB/Spo0J family partition protein [Gammaproteobacteria bacterium]|nr:MAG: ParB/RepB/Spo0J family partition protein [Gammaproteobacteria bacterium]